MTTAAATQTQRGLYARRAYVLLAWLLVGVIVTQVFIAGTAIFADGTRWDLHVTVGRVIEAIPLVMLIPAFLGRFPRRYIVYTVGLFLLTTLQSGFIGLADALDTRELAAFHVVNALAIFLAAWQLATRTARLAFRKG